jgi:hypothetical protein
VIWLKYQQNYFFKHLADFSSVSSFGSIQRGPFSIRISRFGKLSTQLNSSLNLYPSSDKSEPKKTEPQQSYTKNRESRKSDTKKSGSEKSDVKNSNTEIIEIKDDPVVKKTSLKTFLSENGTLIRKIDTGAAKEFEKFLVKISTAKVAVSISKEHIFICCSPSTSETVYQIKKTASISAIYKLFENISFLICFDFYNTMKELKLLNVYRKKLIKNITNKKNDAILFVRNNFVYL